MPAPAPAPARLGRALDAPLDARARARDAMSTANASDDVAHAPSARSPSSRVTIRVDVSRVVVVGGVVTHLFESSGRAPDRHPTRTRLGRRLGRATSTRPTDDAPPSRRATDAPPRALDRAATRPDRHRARKVSRARRVLTQEHTHSIGPTESRADLRNRRRDRPSRSTPASHAGRASAVPGLVARVFLRSVASGRRVARARAPGPPRANRPATRCARNPIDRGHRRLR